MLFSCFDVSGRLLHASASGCDTNILPHTSHESSKQQCFVSARNASIQAFRICQKLLAHTEEGSDLSPPSNIVGPHPRCFRRAKSIRLVRPAPKEARSWPLKAVPYNRLWPVSSCPLDRVRPRPCSPAETVRCSGNTHTEHHWPATLTHSSAQLWMETEPQRDRRKTRTTYQLFSFYILNSIIQHKYNIMIDTYAHTN